MNASRKGSLTYGDYTVGWICALPCEMAAAKAMLGDIHRDLPKRPNDHNTYTLGSINVHNVVVACLPPGVYGSSFAAAVATRMVLEESDEAAADDSRKSVFFFLESFSIVGQIIYGIDTRTPRH